MWLRGRPELGRAGRRVTSSPPPPPGLDTALWTGWHHYACAPGQVMAAWPSPQSRLLGQGTECAQRGPPVQKTLTLNPVPALAGGFQESLYFPHPQCLRWRVQRGTVYTVCPGDRQALAAVNPCTFPCQGPSPPHLQFSAHSRGNSDHMTQGLSSNSVGAPVEKIHLQQHLDLVSLNTRPGWHLSPPPSSLGSLPWPETGANGFSSSPATPASHLISSLC